MEKVKGLGIKWLKRREVDPIFDHACQQVLWTVLATVVPYGCISQIEQSGHAQAGAAYALSAHNGSHVADGQPAQTQIARF